MTIQHGNVDIDGLQHLILSDRADDCVIMSLTNWDSADRTICVMSLTPNEARQLRDHLTIQLNRIDAAETLRIRESSR